MIPLKFRLWDTEEKKMTRAFDIGEYSYSQDSEFGDYDLPGDIFMQSTGLLDIIGREIFVGDICEFPSWNDRLGILEIKMPDIFLEMEKHPLILKVVGNIYQSPELLK